MGHYSGDGLTRPNTMIMRISQLREAADHVADYFLADQANTRYGVRIINCAIDLKEYPGLKYGNFLEMRSCKHRHCPICQWSKSRRWRSQAHQVLDTQPASNGKWLYLTLTVRNCHVTELAAQLTHMKGAFRRMMKRDFWRKYVKGGIRFIEVDEDRSDTEMAHPHFHCLLFVSPSLYAGKNYQTEAEWAEVWRACLRETYIPQVKLSRLKGEGEGLKNAVLTKISYSMKPRLQTPSRLWFLEMVKQMRDVQLVTPFGELRKWFADLRKEESNEVLRERNEIREGHRPTTLHWNEHAAEYERTA